VSRSPASHGQDMCSLPNQRRFVFGSFNDVQEPSSHGRVFPDPIEITKQPCGAFNAVQSGQGESRFPNFSLQFRRMLEEGGGEVFRSVAFLC